MGNCFSCRSKEEKLREQKKFNKQFDAAVSDLVKQEAKEAGGVVEVVQNQTSFEEALRRRDWLPANISKRIFSFIPINLNSNFCYNTHKVEGLTEQVTVKGHPHPLTKMKKCYNDKSITGANLYG